MASSLKTLHRSALVRPEPLGWRRFISIIRLLVAGVSMFFANVRRRAAERRAMSDLAALSDYQLRDIGLNRTDIRSGDRRIFTRSDL
jgi:uncharacterized protein YjiS (DUF1127 family)